MRFLDDLNAKFRGYLYGEINLVQLREWFAPISMDIYSGDAEPEAIRIVNAMIGEFSDFDESFFSETQLKQNLANALYASFVSQYKEMHLGLAPNPNPTVVTGTVTDTLRPFQAVASIASVGTGRAWEYA